MAIYTLWILSFTLYCVWKFFLNNFSKKKSDPPGPKAFPVIGSLPYLAMAHSKPHLAPAKLAEKYGDVMRVKLGPHEYVIVSSTKALNDLLRKEETVGRPNHGTMRDRAEVPNTGIAMAVGESWKIKRTWMVNTLKEMGIGRTSSFEESTRSMIHKLQQQFQSDRGGSSAVVQVDGELALTAGTMMWRLLTGSNTPHDEVDCKAFLSATRKWSQTGNVGRAVLLIFPFLKHIIPNVTGYTGQMEVVNVGNKIAKKLYKKLRGIKGDVPETFFHSYILEEMKGTPGFFEKDFNITFNDIMLAAMDSTNAFMQSLLLFLTRYSKKQEKLYQEITTEFPIDHVFTIADLKSLVYTQSFMLEVHRLTMVFTNWAPRTLVADINYRNFHLNKGITLLPNPHAAFKSKEDFGPDADLFRPERFIDSDDTTRTTDLKKLVTPFSIGKRSCPGESVAQVVTFLFLVYTVRGFKFEPVPGENVPPEDFLIGIGAKPVPFKVLVSPRVK